MRHLDYILFTRAGDGRWPRYQAKSLACPGCVLIAVYDRSRVRLLTNHKRGNHVKMCEFEFRVKMRFCITHVA